MVVNVTAILNVHLKMLGHKEDRQQCFATHSVGHAEIEQFWVSLFNLHLTR